MHSPNQSYQTQLKTQVGTLFICANEAGITKINWSSFELESDIKAKKAGKDKVLKHLTQAKQEITEYLEGKRKKFTLKLILEEGTEFQQKTWKALTLIPYGKTLSYEELAIKISNKNACRAVGNANGKNPFSIVIPCHRVLAKNHKLGGYTGGLDKKRFLLALEGIEFNDNLI